MLAVRYYLPFHNYLLNLYLMLHFICDMCGKGVLVESDVRYEVTIKVKSAYDVMEITNDELKRDLKKEMNELLDKIKDKDPQEIEDEVYKVFKFDLCRECQRKFIKNPLVKQS